MKKLLPGVTILFAVCLSIVSCSEELTKNEVVPENDPQTRAVYNKHLSFIESMGFSTTDIIEEEDCYVVEGDIVLPKTAIDSLMQLPQTRQARYKYKIEHGWENGIRVKITSANITDAGWLEATRRAIDIWNAVPDCPVYFYKITKPILVHDTRVFISNKVEEVADADYPIIGGLPGKQLRINPAYNYFSLEEKTYVLVHEFGHILGLAHTNFRDKTLGQSQDGRTQMSGTPLEEDDSVMYSHSADRDWGEWRRGWGSVWDPSSLQWVSSPDALLAGHFTGGDILAIQSLYGSPDFSIKIDGPAALNPHETATYTIVPAANLQDYIGQFTEPVWTLSSGATEVSRTHSSITVQLSGTNTPFTISASTSYSSKNMSASRTVEARFSIKGPASVGFYEDVQYTVNLLNLPAGTVFNGFAVSRGKLTSTAGGSITVEFTSPGLQTISADFTLPNGDTYISTKEVEVRECDGTVYQIKDYDGLNHYMAQNRNYLCVLFFHAQWCGPCKVISPRFQNAAGMDPRSTFLKIDVDECEEIADDYNISAMPTFVFLLDGIELERFSGANPAKLFETVDKYNDQLK